MCYFRFKRQWICASECLNGDVMAITDKGVIEVEIKISKYDLWKGEAKKGKHKRNYEQMSDEYKECYKNFAPNRFYICVPRDMREEAKKWVEATNKKYGVIQYHPGLGPPGSNIFVSRTARTLHDGTTKGLEGAVMMRVCSENIGLMGNLLKPKEKV